MKYQKQKYLLGIVIGVFFLFSCKKDTTQISVETISFPLKIDLFSTHFFDGQNGFVCGGIKSESGYIFRTSDGGSSWEEVYSSDKFLKDISFLNTEIGYACGDSILILKTEDGGNSWAEMEYPWIPAPNYILPLNHIQIVNDSMVYVTGGGEFSKGLIFRTRNWGWWWYFNLFDNELSESHFKSFDEGIFCGYGVMDKTSDGGQNYQPIDIKGDFYTAMHFIDDDLGFACGYNGGIYKTTDCGDSWKKIYRTNFVGKRLHFNDITFSDVNNGIIVGNNGIALITNNGGNNWQEVSSFTSENLLSVFANPDGSIWITAEKGMLFKFRF
jgi:photosystem II stability/assembly factor-like uncharacterized protein